MIIQLAKPALQWNTKPLHCPNHCLSQLSLGRKPQLASGAHRVISAGHPKKLPPVDFQMTQFQTDARPQMYNRMGECNLPLSLPFLSHSKQRHYGPHSCAPFLPISPKLRVHSPFLRTTLVERFLLLYAKSLMLKSRTIAPPLS